MPQKYELTFDMSYCRFNFASWKLSELKSWNLFECLKSNMLKLLFSYVKYCKHYYGLSWSRTCCLKYKDVKMISLKVYIHAICLSYKTCTTVHRCRTRVDWCWWIGTTGIISTTDTTKTSNTSKPCSTSKTSNTSKPSSTS